ncbi:MULTISPECIES: hypothetical protein [unclassified Nitratiruptor]|uniref:hypothetical protein n=1 Tax=unclassified Nitratiruptor TaxID=2624044 RepID=UPI0018ED20E3|nr:MULTISPECIES: hypothetical protein [unclassified Nitratiruptor]
MSHLRYLFLISVLIFLSGCAHKVTLAQISPKFQSKSSKERQLVQRYKEYWDYFAKKQFEKAYYYELPHQRFLHSLKWYKEFNEPNDQNYTTILRSINFPNNYTANIHSTYISQDKKTSFNFTDKWYLIGGEWYHLMKTTKLPTFHQNID